MSVSALVLCQRSDTRLYLRAQAALRLLNALHYKVDGVLSNIGLEQVGPSHCARDAPSSPDCITISGIKAVTL
eukprot:2123473-Rhodomonas_salina.5